ncbi:MAG: hypothetical protein WDN72_03135 [Alphaproteobacteria bacterium]
MGRWVVMLVATFGMLAAASAQTVPEQNRALVVIRFNQAHVYYEDSLYGAISQAVAAKPDVMFDVVSYAPNGSDKSRWQQVASGDTQAVVASMERMGVPASRIRVSGQYLDGIRYDEVHVFVH